MANRKPAPKKRKIGRPSLYTEALAAKICRRLAEGESLRAICADKAMPGISIEARLGFSPDGADAAALTFAFPVGNFDNMDWGNTYDDGGYHDRNPVSGY